jgi:hemerythrin-like domain-containing protein
MPETVSKHLTADHRKLEELLADVAQMVDDGEVERADHVYQDFLWILRWHLRIEEEILHPIFDERVASRNGLPVLRVEHRELEDAAELGRRALDRGDAAGFRDARETLDGIMRAHHDIEERVLFPSLDRVMGWQELEQMIAGMVAA